MLFMPNNSGNIQHLTSINSVLLMDSSNNQIPQPLTIACDTTFGNELIYKGSTLDTRFANKTATTSSIVGLSTSFNESINTVTSAIISSNESLQTQISTKASSADLNNAILTIQLNENDRIDGDALKLDKTGGTLTGNLLIESETQNPKLTLWSKNTGDFNPSIDFLRNSSVFGADGQTDYRLTNDGGIFKLQSHVTGQNFSGLRTLINIISNLDFTIGDGNNPIKLNSPAVDIAGELSAENAFIGKYNSTQADFAQFSHTNFKNDTQQYCLIQRNTGATILNAGNNEAISFRNNNIDRMILTPNGNLGVGTINPTVKLDIVGDAKIRGRLNLGQIETSSSAQTLLQLEYKMSNIGETVRILRFVSPVDTTSFDDPFVIETFNSLTFKIDAIDALLIKPDRCIETTNNLDVGGALNVNSSANVSSDLIARNYKIDDVPLITQIYAFYQHTDNPFQINPNMVVRFMNAVGTYRNNFGDVITTHRAQTNILPYSMTLASDDDNAGNTNFIFDIRVKNDNSEDKITPFNSTSYATATFNNMTNSITKTAIFTPHFLQTGVLPIPAGRNWGLILSSSSNTSALYEVLAHVFFSQVSNSMVASGGGSTQ